MVHYLMELEKKFRETLQHENGRPIVHNILRRYDRVREIWGSEVLKKSYLDFDWYWDLFLSQGIGELAEFLGVLKQLKKREVGLEIGFFKGGSHIVFREFFDKFISVEINPESFLMYMQNNIFNEKSEFIIGPSIHPKVLDRVKERAGGSLNFIFIDGGHDYQDIKSDFLNYWPLLSMGGLIAMHDTIHPTVFPEARKFIEELGKYLDLKHIQVDYSGISYVIKDEKNFNVELPVNKFICSLDHIENNAKICLYGAGQKGSLWRKCHRRS